MIMGKFASKRILFVLYFSPGKGCFFHTFVIFIVPLLCTFVPLARKIEWKHPGLNDFLMSLFKTSRSFGRFKEVLTVFRIKNKRNVSNIRNKYEKVTGTLCRKVNEPPDPMWSLSSKKNSYPVAYWSNPYPITSLNKKKVIIRNY